MNRATVKRLEKALAVDDNVTRKLVSCLQVENGVECHECGAIHADVAEVERLHGGPGVLIVVEQVVEAAARPA